MICQEWPGVVSWAKGPRYRPNRIQSGKSRGAVEYINVSSVLSSGQFCGKSLRDPGHGVSEHVFDGTRKRQRDAKGSVSC